MWCLIGIWKSLCSNENCKLELRRLGRIGRRGKEGKLQSTWKEASSFPLEKKFGKEGTFLQLTICFLIFSVSFLSFSLEPSVFFFWIRCRE